MALNKLLAFFTPQLMLRLCLVAVVWGAAVFGGASVVRQIVQMQLPGLEGFISATTTSYQQALLQSSNDLKNLLADGRLTAAFTNPKGPDDTALRRVLYEYRYLHAEDQFYLRDLMRHTDIRTEGTALSADETILAQTQSGGVRQWLGVNPLKPMLVTARAIPGLKGGMVVGVLGQPLADVFKNVYLPTLDPLAAAEAPKTRATLATRQANGVQVVAPGQAATTATQLALIDLTRPALLSEGDNILIVRPLKRIPGWAVVIHIPLNMVSAAAAKAQWLITFAALALTVLIFGRSLLGQLRLQRRAGTNQAPTWVDKVHHQVTRISQPLAQAMKRATVWDSLIEPDFAPNPDKFYHPNTHGLPPSAAQPHVAGSSGGAQFVTGSTHRGSSVHQRAMAAGHGATPTPPSQPQPAAPPTPQLEPEVIRNMVKRAIEEDLLDLAYQPIYHATDGVPSMHEVFVRLPGTEGSKLAALNFLPQAAQMGLMPQIDAQVLRKVLKLHFANARIPVTPLSLNVSSTTVADLDYLADIQSIGDPNILGKLQLEVRSGELLQDPGALNLLKKCQTQGVKLAVDYFGGGKTMLEATKNLGFDFIKLDALSFWHDIARRKELVGLARVALNIHLPIILEKIESIQMEIMARKVGIPYLQGYHLQRPGPKLITSQLPGWQAKMTNVPLSSELDEALASPTPAGPPPAP